MSVCVCESPWPLTNQPGGHTRAHAPQEQRPQGLRSSGRVGIDCKCASSLADARGIHCHLNGYQMKSTFSHCLDGVMVAVVATHLI